VVPIPQCWAITKAETKAGSHFNENFGLALSGFGQVAAGNQPCYGSAQSTVHSPQSAASMAGDSSLWLMAYGLAVHLKFVVCQQQDNLTGILFSGLLPFFSCGSIWALLCVFVLVSSPPFV